MKILGLILLLLPTYLFGQQTINKENLSKPEFTYWDFNKQRIQSVGSYYKDQLGVNNDKHGTWKYYDKFGKLEEERTFFRGKLNGKVILYFPNGKMRQEGYFKLDKQDSIYREWNENGSLALEGQYEMDIPKGLWKNYYIDGRIKSEEKEIEGLKHIISFWLPDSLLTQLVKNGSGEMQTYYTTGSIKESYTYENGLPNGPFV